MADPRNPYTPPTAQVADPVERPDPLGLEAFIPNGRTVAAGRGAEWIGDAWRLFRARPGMWFLVTLLTLLIYIVVGMLPLASFASLILWPFFVAGIMVAADLQRRTGTFELSTLFAGFGRQAAALLLLAGVAVLSQLVLFVSLGVLVGTDVAMQMTLHTDGDVDPARILSADFALAMLVYLALVLPISAATWLAAPLIMLNDLPAGTAMKMSFVGAFRNVLSGLVFGLCLMGLLIVAIIPLGLGLLVLAPVMVLTTYTVYRDVFFEPTRQPTA